MITIFCEKYPRNFHVSWNSQKNEYSFGFPNITNRVGILIKPYES